MGLEKDKFFIETCNLLLEASLVSWDTEIFSFPIGQINQIKILNSKKSIKGYSEFESWRDDNCYGLISCRISHDLIDESLFLEGKGFRFIETVLHPKLNALDELNITDQGLKVVLASKNDLINLRRIAESAFKNERFHIDPRIDSSLADIRYGRWVSTTIDHPLQFLFKILEKESIVALFIIEVKTDGDAYWHLTAVAPEYQGRGYGRRAWLTMLRYHQNCGHKAVSTTISARNISVLNLYSSLCFKFEPPDMTFHWIKE
jgi:RimJ/RimL family protein N-acetyltransferase